MARYDLTNLGATLLDIPEDRARVLAEAGWKVVRRSEEAAPDVEEPVQKAAEKPEAKEKKETKKAAPKPKTDAKKPGKGEKKA